MFQRLNSRAGHYVLLLLVTAALFLPNLGVPGLWDIDEGHNAEAAREMLASGNWITPTFNFQMRVDKPALLYWLQASAYRLFGVNEFAARLPSALAAMLTVLLAYELGRRLFGVRTGLLAGLMLASAAMFSAAAHFANPDALLNACTLLTFVLFWQSYPHGGWGWLVLTGISTGLGVLAKGPVGVVLPLAVIWLFLLWSRQFTRLLDRRVLLGVLLFLLVVLPWCILVGSETKGQFLKQFLFKHNMDRYRVAMEQHSGPGYYYVLTLLAGFVPWSIFLAPTLWYAWKGEGGQGRETEADRGAHPLRLLATVLGAFYGGLQGYGLGYVRFKGEGEAMAAPLPGATVWDLLLPALGLALVGAAAGWVGAHLILRMRRPNLTPDSPEPAAETSPETPVAAAAAYRFLWCWIGVYFVFFSMSGTKLPNYILPIYPAVAILTARFLDRWRRGVLQPPAWVMPFSVACLAVVGVGTVVGLLIAGGVIELHALRGRYLPGLEPWAILGILPLLGALAAWWCMRRQSRTGLVVSLVVAAVLFTGSLGAWGGPSVDRFKAPRPLVQTSEAGRTDLEIRVGCYQYYQPSLVFYCRREVLRLGQETQVAEFLEGPLPVYLFVPATVWDSLANKILTPCRLVGRQRDLYRGCEVVVVTNR